MAAAMKLLMLAALLQMGACKPSINIEQNQEVNIDGCCDDDDTPDKKNDDTLDKTNDDTPDKKESCVCGRLNTLHGEYLIDACYQLLCEHGEWKNKGRYDDDCGNCDFGGDPMIYTYDTLDDTTTATPVSKVIMVNVTGEYVMTQPGDNPVPATYGVNGHFTDNSIGLTCTDPAWSNCIDGATYYEPGIAVRLTLDSNSFKVEKAVKPPPKSHVGAWGTLVIPPDYSSKVQCVKMSSGAAAGALVFQQSSIPRGGQDCTIVIGSEGLTLALCKTTVFSFPVQPDYPWAYISAKESLKKSSPATNSDSQLFGLCNTWNGIGQECFTEQGGTCTPNWQKGTGTNPFKIPDLKDAIAQTWEWP